MITHNISYCTGHNCVTARPLPLKPYELSHIAPQPATAGKENEYEELKFKRKRKRRGRGREEGGRGRGGGGMEGERGQDISKHVKILNSNLDQVSEV